MIVTVTPNPALDLTYPVDAVRLGDTNRVAAASVRAGGKGVNVARVAHQQGYPVLAIAPAGGASGQEFADELAASGVTHRLVPVQASTRRTIAFVEHDSNQTTIFTESGENHTSTEWQLLTDAVASALPTARCLVGSGSLPAGAPLGFYPRLVALATANGVPSIIDTSGAGLLAAAAAGATVLKPNRHELAEATGIGDPLVGARHLLALGAELVLLSLGEEGMVALSASDPEAPFFARLPRVLRGNPTGAGDAAVAAAAVAYATGRYRIDQVLGAATAWSAAAVLMPLAGEISPDHTALAAELIFDPPSFDPTRFGPSNFDTVSPDPLSFDTTDRETR
ncbi:1-phosphofructokinase family hexose kinase [Leifsonia kafniensis]|uniref:1-phosphofructokinase family hexose kinase n=1 Tax=Leifsonia kafniensis TaxID=475957 RepID=A0ABP7JYQ1_9MICO